MKESIVITGLGAVTPIGIGVGAFWDSLLENRCGIGQITKVDVPQYAAEIHDFDARQYLSARLAQDLEPFMQYAFVAAEEALQGSGLKGGSRVGIVMGTALAGISQIENTVTSGKNAAPKYLVKIMGNIAAARLAIEHDLRGPCLTVSTACSSGGDAIYLARMLLQSDQADAVVVMAGEAAMTPSLIQCLSRMGALSKTGESRPFDSARNGFVLGEGGGALVLEKSGYACDRGAPIRARLLGCANNNDAFNPVMPEPNGSGAAECMRLALQDASLRPEEIDYINAHGTATVAGDLAESLAIRQVFGASDPLVSSTKGATGHLMGAGGLVELIACVRALEDGVLPVNLNLCTQDPACKVRLVTEKNRYFPIRTALSNSMGFGGQNSCVILGKENRNDALHL